MEVGSKGNERIAESGYYDISYFGWPVFMAESSAEIVPKRPNPIISTYKDWSFHSLIINLAAALAVLAATALACEYRIRRREARKP